MTHQLVLVNCIYSSVKNTHIHNYHKNEQKNRMYLCMRHEKKVYLFFSIKISYATIKSLKYEKSEQKTNNNKINNNNDNNKFHTLKCSQSASFCCSTPFIHLIVFQIKNTNTLHYTNTNCINF